MKLILRQAVENLGASGDIVDVKPGYARNFLVPQGLAFVASAKNLVKLEAEKTQAEEGAKRDYLEARRRASQLKGASITFAVKAGEDGKLFGSVTNADVAEQLNQLDLDFEVDRRLVVLDEPLKALGTVTVSVHLHSQVDAEVEVNVEREEA